MQGFSRYDAMIRLTRSIRYTHLRSCGHLTFVGAPLEQSLTLIGWPMLTLWVESSDADADLFAYLEDQDPETGKARCVRRPERIYKHLLGHSVELYKTFAAADADGTCQPSSKRGKALLEVRVLSCSRGTLTCAMCTECDETANACGVHR